MEPTIILGLGALGLNAIGSTWNAFQGKKISDRNYDMQKETLNYQKYLNNNQIQMQTADALKAGINPLAMNGTGDLNSGNYSNIQASQADVSGISSIVNTMMSNRTAEKNAETAAASAKTVAETAAESAKRVAEINAESQERQTQMKIKADTEAQKSQQEWQSYENWEERLFTMAENNYNRKNALHIARVGAKAMTDVAEINDKLQRWINTYKPTVTDLTSGKVEVDGNPGESANILSVTADRLNAQVNQLFENEINEQNYRSQLLEIQKELKELQRRATEAKMNTDMINSIANVTNSVSNALDTLNPMKPRINLYQ